MITLRFAQQLLYFQDKGPGTDFLGGYVGPITYFNGYMNHRERSQFLQELRDGVRLDV
jgi:hypothetical protein